MSIGCYLRQAGRISGDTGSDQAVSWVKAWLDECTKNHMECGGKDPALLPTRVLAIEGPNKVRLWNSRGKVASYACLSYCWGARHPIQTTASTHDHYRKGVPWTELPKSFQDAISFVFRLEFKYIWIDSLCILQDSIEDGFHEGSKMSHTYRNSTMTLAAILGEDSSSGLYSVSDAHHVSRELRVTGAEGVLINIHHREPLEHTYVPSALLENRGWAFKERLLSSCVVLFGKQELLWECRKGNACECLGRHTTNTMYMDGKVPHMTL